MSSTIILSAVDVGFAAGTLTIDYTWTGGQLPTVGPVSLILTLQPRGDRERSRRFGAKWIDGVFNSEYVHSQVSWGAENIYTATALAGKPLPSKQSQVRFSDEPLKGLGADLVWRAVICTDHDLEPTIAGELMVDDPR